MEINEIEVKIKNVCKELVLQLRPSGVIDTNLIQTLHSCLDSYIQSVRTESMVSKEIVGILIYTFTRFYHQSKFSKNSQELLDEFERLYGKLLRIFTVEGNSLS
jgi:hypothetical protein